MPLELSFREIAGFRLVTGDLARLVGFYRELGFVAGAATSISAAEMQLLGLLGAGLRVTLSLGPSRLDLDFFEYAGRPYPSDSTACDLIFQHLALVTDDAQSAWRRARDAGAAPISRDGPVTLPHSAGPHSPGQLTAVKFRDPEGHPLEFLQFPSGANPHWHGSGIMGIDHSAISVSDVAASQRFYTSHAMSQGPATVNEGPTQDALDGLEGVQVNIVPIRANDGPPHIELLGYRHPLGRALSLMTANDIAASRIVWQADKDALVRDPDGHLHQLTRSDQSPADMVSPR